MFKLNRRRSLSSELFCTYTVAYTIFTFLLILLILTSMILYGFLCGHNIYNDSFKKIDNKLQENYTLVSDNELYDISGFIVKIDKDNTISYSKGKVIDEFKDKKISLNSYMSLFGIRENNEVDVNNDFLAFSLIKDFNNAIANTKINGKYCFYTKYIKEESSLLVFGCPYYEAKKPNIVTNIVSNEIIFKAIILIDIMIFFTFAYFFSKISAKTFVHPINSLLMGVKQIAEGNYDIRISSDKKNEFKDLANGFNKMAETISKEKVEKEKLQKMREMLILDVSHDLKNPLSSVLGYSETLLNSETLSYEEREKYLTIIYNNSKRANKLLNDLFEYSLYENCDTKFEFKSMDICELLRQIIASRVDEFEEKKFNYKFDIDEKPCYVLLNDLKFTRAVNNIIDNKIKYNRVGAEININTVRKFKSIYIYISDDGDKIPDELKDKIFNAFVRLDKSRNSNTGGTGLGLSITKNIIKKHGGTVKIESSNKGTVFKIEMPIECRKG
ncbi:HAMP domain-containing sensor histidine kinase [Clostridium sp. BJN0001]|uniref:sensor histidine kinase n=1 Tax=Clostridium sp. BJN0001 TaxID=2930219 RepID=UPI001FD50595|nr:HAMP domain-containing sensor histidine kinase [Clostridium sp. BJN0001]